jgi:ABC-type phosphate/phosphonate transport system ATPase subunit
VKLIHSLLPVLTLPYTALLLLLLLLQVGLSDKLLSLAGELSGGQRRKLSVAVAFLGDAAGEGHSRRLRASNDKT